MLMSPFVDDIIDLIIEEKFKLLLLVLEILQSIWID